MPLTSKVIASRDGVREAAISHLESPQNLKITRGPGAWWNHDSLMANNSAAGVTYLQRAVICLNLEENQKRNSLYSP